MAITETAGRTIADRVTIHSYRIASYDLADTARGDLKVRESCGCSEQKFVVVTSCERLLQCRIFTNRYTGAVQIRTNAACPTEMAKILQQTIGHIDGAVRDPAQRDACFQSSCRLKIP